MPRSSQFAILKLVLFLGLCILAACTGEDTSDEAQGTPTDPADTTTPGHPRSEADSGTSPRPYWPSQEEWETITPEFLL